MGEQDRRADPVEQPGEPVGVHLLGRGQVGRQRAVAGDELVHRPASSGANGHCVCLPAGSGGQ